MVIEIHPEELFDKLSLGGLSAQEAERLRAHLESCAVCRFELEARSDFDEEFQRSLGRTEPRAEAPLSLPRRTRSRRRRAVIWTAAAAALFVATGALAGVVTGKAPWKLVESLAAPAPAADPGPVSAAPKRKATAPAVAVTLPTAAPAASLASACGVEPCAELTPASSPVPSVRSLAATGTAEKPLPPAPVSVSASALFADANRARASGDSGRAIQLYRNLQRQFPRSREAELSQITLARLFLDSGDARSALGGFDAYLGRGTRTLQAEALVGRALSLRALGRRESEVAAWREVLERHPRSVYARQATERLSALGRP